MKYSLDFTEYVQSIAKSYIEMHKGNHEVRNNHKQYMNYLDQIGKEVKVFKQIANCIESILWMEDQPEDL